MHRSPATGEPVSRRLPCIALAVLLAAASVYIVATTDALPDVVATHFDGAGRPNGWMTRGGYRVFMLVFTVGLSLFVALAVGWLPRRFPGATNIPNRAHWLAPERREAALAYLARHGCLLGGLMAVFSAAVHALILDAHTVSPPRLANERLFVVLAAFLIALAVLVVSLLRRFRAPRPR